MTSLLTIFTVIGIISVCYAIAKYNKSDALFWSLLISLFAGMAGGAIFNKLSNERKEEKKSNFTQVYNPTQELPAQSIDFYALLGVSSAYRQNPVSKVIEIPARDSKITSIAPSKFFEEIRGQPRYFMPFNKGTPHMPFDTS